MMQRHLQSDQRLLPLPTLAKQLAGPLTARGPLRSQAGKARVGVFVVHGWNQCGQICRMYVQGQPMMLQAPCAAL
jgi:hypothetical protein